MSNGGVPIWRRRLFRKRSTAGCNCASERPLIPTVNEASMTSWPVLSCTLAGIGIRLNGRGSAAEEDTNAEHRIRITRIARTECSPGLACGRGRIVESRAVRKSGVSRSKKSFAEEGKLCAGKTENQYCDCSY